MSSPIRKTSGDNKFPNGDGQGANRAYADFSARLRSCAEEKGYKSGSLASAVGVTRGTMARYWDGDRLPPSDTLIALSEALSVSPFWLIRGGDRRTSSLVDVNDADWISVPEHDLRDLTDMSKGPVTSLNPMRRDWLNRVFGQSNGIWLARLPSDLPRLDLREGDLVFLRDVDPGEAQDGAIYIVRVWGHLTVARIDALLSTQMNAIERNLEDRRLAPRDIGTEDGQAILVARVLGAPLRRL